jgi:predicted Zn-dependent protease
MRSSSCSRRLGAVWLAAALAGLPACGTLSIPEEQSLGAQVDREVRAEVRLVRDDAIVGYVRQIANRLVSAAGPQPFSFQFNVVDEPEEINAFALPAGYIYIHSAVLLRAENVSEVAGVIGHEIGHVVKRHVAQNYRRQQGVGMLHQLGVITAGLLGGGVAAGAANLGGGLAATAYLNTYGREAERESDSFAVAVLPRAGYDPTGLVTFFDTLRKESGGGEPPAFLSSHPATSERIENTRREIAASKPPAGLRVHDDGKLEIIQRRIKLLSGGR